MPCNSDYMEPSRKEIEVSNLLYVRDELNGIPVDPSKWNRGYHPQVYNLGVPNETVNRTTAEVCKRLQERDVSKLSLEVQLWWRDHQKADVDRLERELAAQETAKAKEAALAKLTIYERQLLGL